MAEIVGEAVLSTLLQRAFNRLAPRDIVNFLKGNKRIGELVDKLKIVLLPANAVLNDAEERQFTDSNVKKWLDELNDAVYVAEDLLDEIATEALRSKSEAEIQTFPSKVRSIFSYFVSSFDKRIESELEKILDRLEFIIKQKDALGLVASVAQKGTLGLKVVQSRPLTTSYPEVYGVFGRDKEKEAIFEKFQSNGASDDGICVVPIVGMGGVGKTTLARLIYNDRRIEERFDNKVWVCVSENFDRDRIVKTISEAIPNYQTGKQIFLVLDDIWNEDRCDWVELIKDFRHQAEEIKIIVTTRSEKVALNVCTVEAFSLKPLSDNECWSLFEKHAFINGKAGEFPILEDIGKQIVQKCKGLPLAAKALGGLLRCEQDPTEWTKILENNIWNLPEGQLSILPALRLSYHYLPSHLKRCFAYCSILPKGYEFKKEEVVLLWMAQDFLQQCEGNGGMEKLGEGFFDVLVSRSLFQRSSNDESYFIMHDLVNDLAKFISGEFCFRLEEDGELNKITKKTRHFFYPIGQFNDSKKFEILYVAKGLRTFLGEKCSPHLWQNNDNVEKIMIDDLLEEFKTLRVLSLSLGIRELPDSIDNLKQLRYLNIGGTGINHLPDSLCKLYNLQTLILSSFITKLPTNMSKLINLRCLDNSGAKMEEMPPHMDKLKNLIKLPVFGVGKHDDGSSIKELGELQHLSGKLYLLNLENVQCINKDTTEVILKNKQYLSELRLEWKHGHIPKYSEKERILLEQLCPHTNLNSLTITNYEGTSFPKWLGDPSFSKMVSIELSDCDNCFSLPPLGQLPDLKSLRIEYFGKIFSVGLEFCGNTVNPFRALEYLSFSNMPEWQECVLFKGEVFTCLRELYIFNCPKLCGGLPVQLPSLTILHTTGCVGDKTCDPTWAKVARFRRRLATGYRPEAVSHTTEVILKNEQDLSELKVEWKHGHGAEDSEKQRILLEQSCPRTNLNSLTITNYEGTNFPKWLGDSSFSKMVSIELRNCDNCFSLPPLGQLPNLKSLKIECFRGISSVGPEFYGNTINPFKALKHLSFVNMPEWQEWVIFEGEVFTCLLELYIEDCPKLSGDLPVQHPFLTILDIRNCEQLVASLPKSPSVDELECMGKIQIPSGHDYQSLKRVYIKGGRDSNLNSLPPLGQLPALKSLTIEYFHGISSVGPEFYGNTINPFKALKHLSFVNMPEWQEWVLFEGEVFSCLQVLFIDNCPKLSGSLPVQLPSLTNLNITGNWPVNAELYFVIMDSMRGLAAQHGNRVQYSPALHGKSVNIENGVCSILPCLLTEFASVTDLKLFWCTDLESFPSGGLCSPNLSEIVIDYCKNLESLPEGMCTLLPSLVRLELRGCPKLNSFPEGGLPSSLESLLICKCDTLFSRRMQWGLQDLRSLRSFTIIDECKKLESFPEDALLPPNLTDLYITLSNLKSLNGKGFQHLTSLKHLKIWSCNDLDCLLEEVLPTSLCELDIYECRLLKERYGNEKGEGHIPRISIRSQTMLLGIGC